MSKLPISVVIPCHNHHDTLIAAIESAKDASEIIVVDDSSSPRIEFKRVGLLGNHVKLFRINSSFPSGVCHTRNTGIERADNDLIVCLDSDDTFTSNGLAALYEGYTSNTFVYGGYNEVTQHDIKPHKAPSLSMLNMKNIAQATWLFHRSDWFRVCGYDPRYNLGCEDYQLMIKLHLAGVKGIRVDEIVYNYNVNEDGRAAKQRAYFPLIREMLKSDFANFIS